MSRSKRQHDRTPPRQVEHLRNAVEEYLADHPDATFDECAAAVARGGHLPADILRLLREMIPDVQDPLYLERG
jgi:hypothetical protein